MERTIRDWETLPCPHCQGTEFVQIVGLQRREGLGMVETAKGYACRTCNEIVTGALLVQQAEAAQLERQIQELQAQKAALTPSPVPPPAAPSATSSWRKS